VTPRRDPAHDVELAARLREAAVPDAVAAQERGWRVVASAYAGREPLPRAFRTRTRWAAALATAAAVAVAVAVALTPPGEAVAKWFRAVVQSAPAPRPDRTRSALGALPGHGLLLVVGRNGPWIVQRDGARRHLGAYDDATLSPRGLYAGVTRGPMLAAVDLRGGVHWTLTRPARVTLPRWSPDGFRIAYRSGAQLRIVYGDGALDRALAPRSAAVAPAWRPAAAHELAYVAADGAVVVRDADSGRVVWRRAMEGRVRQLAWAPDGRRLLALTPTAAWVLGARGRVQRVGAMAAGVRAVRAAWLPSGRAFAVVRSGPGARASEAVLLHARGAGSRRVLAMPGRLTDVLASPDGRRLLLAAPDADQWLLVPAGGSGRITALSGVGRQFDPGARTASAPPRPAGWIR
jgi:hypothetical protein